MTARESKMSQALHWLDEHVDNRRGRIDAQEFTDVCLAKGWINNSPEAFRAWCVAQAEAIIRRHRKAKWKSHEHQLMLVNYWEDDEESGERVDYYKACGEATLREAVQDLRRLHREMRMSRKKLITFARVYLKRFGDELQLWLDFELPEDDEPEGDEPEGDDDGRPSEDGPDGG